VSRSDADLHQIHLPNEYFHTVTVETLWHPEGVVDPDSGEVRADVRVCMRGTGFFYRIDKADFLVTARHVFTQRAWRTNDWLDPPIQSVTPTYVRLQLRAAPEGGTFDAEKLDYIPYAIPLVDDDENPQWLEHPLGYKVDIAALPLLGVDMDELHYLPLEPKDAAYGDDWRFWVTDDVFIVGYPFGLDHGFFWPLWLRGTVASEPTLMFLYNGDEFPMFLVDSRTRPGNSGSPVLLPRRHFTDTTDDDALPRSRLVGIYSGRINEQSDLGITWHIRELDLLCRSAKRAPKSKS
jgi:hypothetical protein